uniref:Uncharacterized protein n=1 Tax=Strongyloides papillosus TaxID=174720 RepID=A0A0N5B6J8_STREA
MFYNDIFIGIEITYRNVKIYFTMNYSLLVFKKQSTCVNVGRYLSSYKGTGIQRYDEFLKKKTLDKANEGKEENPLDYTIFGNKRKPKEDVFFYSDRVAGRGYSSYSTTLYNHRPYIWAPFRKTLYPTFFIAILGVILCIIDYDFD